MIGPMVQMVLLVTMTHGFRVLGKWVGPRRSGLLMGLPSTTALVLVGCGLERGIDEASGAAEACLVGLAAAAALPLAYARAASAGWRSPASAGSAVVGYLAVAAGLWWVPGLGASACLGAAAAGVALACHLGGRIRVVETAVGGQGRALSASRKLACRTAIPAGYFVSIRLLRAVAGAGFAGRFITFPGGSLAVLVTTHLEAGPETACRMATAMPTGGLGMLAFLTVFRFGCPSLGLGWGTAAGFAAALSVLALVGIATRPPATGQAPVIPRKFVPRRVHPGHPVGQPRRTRAGGPRRNSRKRRGGRDRAFVSRPRRYRRGFSPWVETLSG